MFLVGTLTAVSATISGYPVFGGQAARYAVAAVILLAATRDTSPATIGTVIATGAALVAAGVVLGLRARVAPREPAPAEPVTCEAAPIGIARGSA